MANNPQPSKRPHFDPHDGVTFIPPKPYIYTAGGLRVRVTVFLKAFLDSQS